MKKQTELTAESGRILARLYADDLRQIGGHATSEPCGTNCDKIVPAPSIKLTEDSW
jgi:hypothetical protein